jgi:hypothetical protein
MKPTSIVKDTKYPNMYRLKWEDGILSEDFYNFTRAKDILRNYDLYRRNMEMVGNDHRRKAS